METPPLRLTVATRGSPLALAQTRMVIRQAQALLPGLGVEVKIIRTTGDKLQTAAMAQTPAVPKGLFTKELETALLDGEADFAVHSLKDLPTDLPAGLVLGAVLPRADARDVLIHKAAYGSASGDPLACLPQGGVVASTSTRRREQLLAARPDLKVVDIRGNVGTRLLKLAERSEWCATLLAAAGLARLGFRIEADGRIIHQPDTTEIALVEVPASLRATPLAPETMIPAVGQAAVALEVRADDPRTAALCRVLNHAPTWTCITAERAFLHAMGGGCQSPVAAHAQVTGDRLGMRAISFRRGCAERAEAEDSLSAASALGLRLAERLL